MTGIVAYILSKKGAKIYTDEKFSSIAGGFNYKGSVASIDDLPLDAEKGDEYTLTDDSGTYVFDGDGWYPAGVTGKQGPIGPVGPEGAAGKDGAIQYTAGTGIEITQDNVINSTSDLWESGTGEHSVQTKNNNNNAAGESSVAEGAETDAHSYASHTEGYMTSTGTNADYSHAEGYKTSTQGQASHAEGDNTVTNNAAEHAEGKYNKSNTGDTTADKTISSIGIGNGSGSVPGGERKNAFEVMENGDTYVIGIGNYDGKNYSTADTLQSIIDDIPEVIDSVDSTSTTNALSANMGKQLSTEITNLKNIGRFCAIWNAATGLPTSEPTTTPYTYKVGDYFRIGVAGYRVPTGSTYVQGAYDTVTEETGIGDVWYYDGTQWVKQASSGGGTVQDVQIDGTSVLSGGIANIPVGNSTTLGVFKTQASGGTTDSNGVLRIARATDSEVEAKSSIYKPIVPANLQLAVDTGVKGSTNYTSFSCEMASGETKQLKIYAELV